MINRKPVFGLDGCSPIEASSALHSYSRDMQAYYKVVQGQLLSQLHQVEEGEELTRIKTALQEVNQKLDYFHVLNNAASIVSTVFHTHTMINEVRHPE